MSSAPGRPAIIDTHAHLDESAFAGDRDEVLEAARLAGVRRFVNIGYNPERWDSSRLLREANRDVEIVLGLHPQEASLFDHELERELRDAITALRPVAVGETGFDFARQNPGLAEQARAFRAQLQIATDCELPVVIHQRDAAEALMTELDRWPNLASIVLHSFDGDRRLTDWAIDRQCFVGIGGLACKRAKNPLRALLADVPTERLVLETDAPYLTPPGIKDRRNTPANLPLIAGILAPIWRLTSDELCWTTAANAEALFRFKLKRV